MGILGRAGDTNLRTAGRFSGLTLPLVTGLVAVVATAAAISLSATAAPTTTRYSSGLKWSSGVWGQHSASITANFASWRGRPVDNIALFPSRDTWSTMNDAWWVSPGSIPGSFNGDLVIGVPLWPKDSNVSANADAQWRTFASTLAAKDPDGYVRLGWEMNIGQYWKVTSSNREQWIAAFKRAVTAMHSVAPDLQIVWNPNWGGDQTGTDSRSVFQAVKDYVDVYGIDMYDSYPASLSEANSRARVYGFRGLADSHAYAVANGKKFSVPEWGVACNGAGCAWQGNAGGDNPRHITEVLDFLESVDPSTIAFESYFNETAGYIRSNLYPPNTNPAAGAAYIRALRELAAAPDDAAPRPTTPAPSATPTATPTGGSSPSPTIPMPTDVITDSPTGSPTDSPTASPTDSPTDSSTGFPTDSPTGSTTDSPTTSPTTSATGTPTLPTGSPTAGPSPIATVTVTVTVTAQPTILPTIGGPGPRPHWDHPRPDACPTTGQPGLLTPEQVAAILDHIGWKERG